MGVKAGNEIGRARVIKAHTAAASGNPAGHAAAGCSTTYYPFTDARGSASGHFNFVLNGTFVGTVGVDKTYDDGVTWLPASDVTGTAVSLTAPGAKLLRELEAGVGYRTRCTAYTSGTATARLAQ